MVSLLGTVDIIAAAPVLHNRETPVVLAPRRLSIPIISALLHGVGGVSVGIHGSGGGNPFRGFHRPHLHGRRSEKQVDEASSSSVPVAETDVPAPVDNSALRPHRGDIQPVPKRPLDSHSTPEIPTVEYPAMERRYGRSSEAYRPGRTGSGGQYDKGQPYGR
ncbi:hypothetical protein BGX28_006192 [Mortierella sp. GBA30]|nr:hypothetical protein BGX28_006192 [Mortierella sp. GBA30]